MTESSNPGSGEVEGSTAPSPATPAQVAHLHNAAKNPKTLPKDARISQTLTAAEAHGDKLAAWRAGQLQRIRDIANSKDAKARDAELKARSPPEVRALIKHLNLGALDLLLREANHPDHSLCHELAAGFRLTGDSSSNGLYPPKEDKPATPKHELLNQAESIRDLMKQASRRPAADVVKTLWTQAENEVRAKRLEGPYTEADLNKRFNGRWVFSPRFGKVESDKTREIDDLTISGVNGLTRIGERIVLDTVDCALDLLQQQKDNKAKGRHGQYRLFKGDHQSAYRQCPINPDDYDVAVVGIYHPDRTDLVYYIHHSLPFGSKASCLHYTRVAKGICAILWYWLLLVILSYVDDFHGTAPQGLALQSYECFLEVNNIIGFYTKLAKNLEPAQRGKLLGLILSIMDDHVELDLDPNRKDALLTEIHNTLQEGIMSPAQASSLAGELNFASSAMFGKSGRSYLRVLYNWHYNTRTQAFKPHHQVARALQWFRWAITECPRRTIALGQARKPFILYTDAEFGDQEGAPNGQIGGVLHIPDQNKTEYVSWRPPTELLSKLKQRKTQIDALETLGALVCIYHWSYTDNYFQKEAQTTGGCDVTLYIDSTTAEGCIRKGCSTAEDLNSMCTQIWKTAATLGIYLYTLRVPSAENPADWPSRSEFRRMETLGWARARTLVDPPWRTWLE
ncbi:hypothetical protein FOZ60_010744 [Perkinsus olseni]|uniref:Uncharacterized protein n=1 Tax=Perkinsus olseni TaxID=32597 RepID=A0A7J6NFU8_PEROL|nr:hypothetical protein FOZ60_010744 [Perkinsus olseni]